MFHGFENHETESPEASPRNQILETPEEPTPESKEKLDGAAGGGSPPNPPDGPDEGRSDEKLEHNEGFNPHAGEEPDNTPTEEAGDTPRYSPEGAVDSTSCLPEANENSNESGREKLSGLDRFQDKTPEEQSESLQQQADAARNRQKLDPPDASSAGEGDPTVGQPQQELGHTTERE